MNVKIDFYLILSILILCFFQQAESFLVFYFFVIMHELAHVLVALCLKIKVEEIYFLPFGVNAKFNFNSYRKKEIIIALAGPIFSILIGFILKKYIVQNLFIAIMNLFPIYPLDGGRILKNIIILKLGIINGTEIYQRFARKIIIVFIILNIISLVFLKKYRFLFVSLYIFQMLGEEIKNDRIRIKMKEIFNLEI